MSIMLHAGVWSNCMFCNEIDNFSDLPNFCTTVEYRKTGLNGSMLIQDYLINRDAFLPSSKSTLYQLKYVLSRQEFSEI